MTRWKSGLLLLIGLVTLFELKAQTEQIINYQYDNSGNIIRIFTQSQSSGPVINQLTPTFINRGRTVAFTLSGENLLNISITTEVAGLTITAINPSLNEVTFNLTADTSAPIGDALLRFTTSLGDTEQTVYVAESAPELITSPNPIAVAESASPTNIKLIFSEPRPEDETYAVTINDTNIATTQNNFTIFAGQSEVDLPLTGIANGVTNLSITLPAKFYTYSFPVFVGLSFEDLLENNTDMLSRNLFSTTVGVYVEESNLTLPNTVLSLAVGVSFQDVINPVLSKPVGLLVTDIKNPILSSVVGVNVGEVISYAYSSPVEVIYGTLINAYQSIVVSPDTSAAIDFEGFNLDEVVNISVSPANDITIDTFVTNSENTVLTITLSIGLDAEVGQREIIIEDINGSVVNETGGPFNFEIQ